MQKIYLLIPLQINNTTSHRLLDLELCYGLAVLLAFGLDFSFGPDLCTLCRSGQNFLVVRVRLIAIINEALGALLAFRSARGTSMGGSGGRGVGASFLADFLEVLTGDS